MDDRNGRTVLRQTELKVNQINVNIIYIIFGTVCDQYLLEVEPFPGCGDTDREDTDHSLRLRSRLYWSCL